jgi:hypothetical protein
MMWSAGLPVFGIPGRRFESSRAHEEEEGQMPFSGSVPGSCISVKSGDSQH